MTFRAVAEIVGTRDAVPGDNQAIAPSHGGEAVMVGRPTRSVPRSQRWWLLGMGVAAVCVLAGCGGRSSATPTPTGAAGGSTGIDRFTSPGEAARHLYDAWRAGSRPEALRAAASLVVDDLFSYPVPQDTLTPSECELVEVGYGCHWAGERSRPVMIVEGGASAGYQVVWASHETVTAGHFYLGFGRYTDVIGEVDVTEV